MARSQGRATSFRDRNRVVETQAPAVNKVCRFPHDTTLLDVRSAMPEAREIEEKDGLRLFSLPAALIACSPKFFSQKPVDVRASLSTVRDASEVLNLLLEGGQSTVAGRLAGALRDLTPALFGLLREEQEPAVLVVLGHFLFVYIHPYMDGNGRMGRFLMNVMLASP